MKYFYFVAMGLMGVLGLGSLFLMVGCIAGVLNGAGVVGCLLALFSLFNAIYAGFAIRVTYSDYFKYRYQIL
jgi:hypothetical protein